MTKYNQLFKQQVVNFYFEHHENLAFTLEHFNLPKTTVNCWIAQYKYSGTNGLAVLHRKRLCSPDLNIALFKPFSLADFRWKMLRFTLVSLVVGLLVNG